MLDKAAPLEVTSRFCRGAAQRPPEAVEPHQAGVNEERSG